MSRKNRLFFISQEFTSESLKKKKAGFRSSKAAFETCFLLFKVWPCLFCAKNWKPFPRANRFEIEKRERIMYGSLIYLIVVLLALTLIGLLIEGAKALQERRFFVADTYRNLAECERALNYYSKLLEQNPDDWEIYLKRGNAFIFLRDYQQAIRDYTRALTLHPRDENIFVRRGRSYYTLRKYDEAIWDCTRALNANPHYIPAYSTRGLAYLESGAYELAIRDYTRAIEMDPENTQHYLNREFAYYKRRNDEQALNDYGKTSHEE
jgi:tetratricopeptide (TPR) repeat protein